MGLHLANVCLPARFSKGTLCRVELGYVMKGTEYLVSLETSVVLTKEYNFMVDSEGLLGTTECLTV
jgi:hypothetical protein